MDTPIDLIRKIYEDAKTEQQRADALQAEGNKARQEAEDLRSAAATIEKKYGIIYTGDNKTIDLRDEPSRGAFETALEVFESRVGEVLTLPVIEELMHQAGWKTTAKDPGATVRNTVARLREHGVESVGRGKYRMDPLDHQEDQVLDLTEDLTAASKLDTLALEDWAKSTGRTAP